VGVRPWASGICAVALVSACGGGSAPQTYDQSHSASQIVSDADASVASAQSFHVTIDEKADSGPLTAEIDTEASDAQGTVKSDTVSVHLIHASRQTFIYGADLETLVEPTNPTLAATVARDAADKWVLVPSDIWDSSFGKLLDIKKMTGCLKAAISVGKKGTSIVSGERVVEVDNQAGSKVYVQTAAPHHLVRAVIADGDTCATDSTAKGQTIELSRYGSNFEIGAPADYVELTKLR
jgi:hypothetical protein